MPGGIHQERAAFVLFYVWVRPHLDILLGKRAGNGRVVDLVPLFIHEMLDKAIVVPRIRSRAAVQSTGTHAHTQVRMRAK